MLKTICTFIVLLITCAILCSNKIESRIAHANIEGIPTSQLHFYHMGKGQISSESSNEDDRGEYIHTKRKSELLSSLYGLPYGLARKRNAN